MSLKRQKRLLLIQIVGATVQYAKKTYIPGCHEECKPCTMSGSDGDRSLAEFLIIAAFGNTFLNRVVGIISQRIPQ